MHPNRLDSPDDQRRVTTASIAAVVVFLLAWWVLGAHVPSFGSLYGWVQVAIAAGLAAAAFAVGMSLRDSRQPDPDDPEDPDMGTV